MPVAFFLETNIVRLMRLGIRQFFLDALRLMSPLNDFSDDRRVEEHRS